MCQPIQERSFALLDCREQVLLLAEDVLQECLLKPCDLAGLHLVQVSSDAGVDDRYLLLNGHGSCRREAGTPVHKPVQIFFSIVQDLTVLVLKFLSSSR